jgi:hypothetical protein
VFGYYIASLTLAAIIEADKITYIESKIAVQIYLSIFFTAKMIVTILLSALLIFHLNLYFKGLTTFEMLTKEKVAKNKVHSENNSQKRMHSDHSMAQLKDDQNDIDYINDAKDQISKNI